MMNDQLNAQAGVNAIILSMDRYKAIYSNRTVNPSGSFRGHGCLADSIKDGPGREPLPLLCIRHSFLYPDLHPSGRIMAL